MQYRRCDAKGARVRQAMLGDDGSSDRSHRHNEAFPLESTHSILQASRTVLADAPAGALSCAYGLGKVRRHVRPMICSVQEWLRDAQQLETRARKLASRGDTARRAS